MKIFVYILLTVYFMLNVTFTNSKLDEEPLNVRNCALEIMNNLGSYLKEKCFLKMYYFNNIAKPYIPLIPMASLVQGLDMRLTSLEDWVKYAFYLGERVTFQGIMKPTRFCRTLYLNNDIVARVKVDGNLVYPRIYEDENKNIYDLYEVIKLAGIVQPDVLFGYDNVTPEIIQKRQKCLCELNSLNLYDHMSEKKLFDKLYRMSGIQPRGGMNNENDSNISLYSRHYYGKTELLEGTLDALPFCRKCSVFDALNDNSTTNVSRGESSSQRDRSRSPPKLLLNLFPANPE